MEGEGKAFLAFSCFTEGFASAEATKGLSDRPLETFGPMQRTGFSIENGFFVEGEGKAFLAFFLRHRGFRLCGGDQRAFRSPFGNLRPHAADGIFHRKRIFCGRRGKGFPCIFLLHRGFRLCGGDQGAFPSPPWTHLGGDAIRFRRPLPCLMCSKNFFAFPKRITETVANLPSAQPPLFSISYALHMSRDSSLFRFTMKSCALVTIPRAERLPRSLSLFTVNSEISTQ